MLNTKCKNLTVTQPLTSHSGPPVQVQKNAKTPYWFTQRKYHLCWTNPDAIVFKLEVATVTWIRRDRNCSKQSSKKIESK